MPQGKYIRKNGIIYGSTGKRWKADGLKNNTGSFQFNNLNKDIAYILGVYLSDGTIYSNKNNWKMFTLEVIDKDFAQKTQECLNRITGVNKEINVCNARSGNAIVNYKAYCGNQELCRWLQDITSCKRYIPLIIFDADKTIKKEFISAIFDAEGFVSVNPNYNSIHIGFAVTSLWIFEVKELLEMLKVKVLPIRRDEKGRITPIWWLNVNTESFVENGLYFNIYRKKKRILNWKKHILNSQRLNVQHPKKMDEDTVQPFSDK